MPRSWRIWLVFGLCLLIILAATAAVSVTALRLDQSEARARRQAALEENVRLALWRMDAAVAPFIAQENIRPYFVYTPFYPAERAYTRMFQEIQGGEVLVPSPLLTGGSPEVLVYFQYSPDGQLTSPQVPTGNMRDLAEARYVSQENIEIASRRLAELSRKISRDALLAQLRKPETSAPQPAHVETAQVLAPQVARSAQEFQAREMSQMKLAQQSSSNQVRVGSNREMQEGVLKPMWAGESLLLARRVSVDGREFVQGCLLDWPRIRDSVLTEARALLPEAGLEPFMTQPLSPSDTLRHAPSPANEGRMMASLPVKLVPGEMPLPALSGVSPLRLALGVAWVCVLLAGIVGAVVMAKAISLSERRAAFVSAVTHELRTPLTSLRMYTEMLAGGMVSDEAKRQEYMETLKNESERLGRLVENVLSYARLENGRRAAPPMAVALRDLVARVQPRLAARAEEAGMKLEIVPEGPWELQALVDADVVEQILFNLVDNACKYARTASDKRIEIHADNAKDGAVLRVCDHGPGIAARESRRIFEPFHKSARDAAHSAPGVGLGLALSRRLARSLGGNLRLVSRPGDGACFEVSLPLAPKN